MKELIRHFESLIAVLVAWTFPEDPQPLVKDFIGVNESCALSHRLTGTQHYRVSQGNDSVIDAAKLHRDKLQTQKPFRLGHNFLFPRD
uniref:Uncharacterized protein n=1 Tax=Anguilla anguilla TaxID=7936 RepID=A0A0E9R7T6_ANGAN